MNTQQAQAGQQQVQVTTQEAQQQAASTAAVVQNTGATQHTEYAQFGGQVRLCLR